MCGIAGIVNFSGNEEKKSLLRQMIALLHHRGPDASGIYDEGPAGLAHARLSIIDLEGGDQPIHNEDKSVWLVFNGEIFNYPELRQELVAKGHRFYTKSDTEVIVHLYEEKGLGFFQDLNGQFALALWDKNREELILGRDRLGIRPFFYYCQGSRLVFGSEIKAIFADQSIVRKLDTKTLGDIFTGWTPLGVKTSFVNIKQIPPGCCGSFSHRGFAVNRYWDFPCSCRADQGRSLDDWTGELADVLTDAVRIRLRADVPVGAYLSGGLDSTLISSLVKKNFDNRLCTFSVGFNDAQFDETAFQKQAVASLGTEHRSISCAEEDIGRVFPEVVRHAEAPILRTAPAPLFMLSRLVQESGFKVVLTGEGADEIFAGYNIFKEDQVRRFWARQPDSVMRPRLLERLYPYVFKEGNSRARSFLEGFFKKNLSDTANPGYSHLLRWLNTRQLHNFFTPDVKEQVGSFAGYVERYSDQLPEDYMAWPSLSRAQYNEATNFMPGYLLSSQGDRMTMAHSIEGRFPFLDHRVVELAGKMPPRYKLNCLNEKFILKRVAQDLIPENLVKRPKQPYRAPIKTSFFGENAPEYVGEMLSEKSLQKYGYFDSHKVGRLVAKCNKQSGALLSERENMALVGILSTQLLCSQFES